MTLNIDTLRSLDCLSVCCGSQDMVLGSRVKYLSQSICIGKINLVVEP